MKVSREITFFAHNRFFCLLLPLFAGLGLEAADPVITQGTGPFSFTVEENSSQVSWTTWDKRFGGSADDTANDIIATADGGYLLVGSSNSSAGGDRNQTSRGGHDYWAVKIDANGTKIWDKRFGGGADDYCRRVVATTDGGYLLAGYSNSNIFGDKTEGNQGNNDYWAVKIDENGTKVWDNRLGGRGDHIFHADVATTDGGSLLAG